MRTATEHTHHIHIRDHQLEMNPDPSAHHGDDVEGRLRHAQTQLEELQAQREELERLKQEAEVLNARRRDLISTQVEMSERLASSLTQIDRQVYEMRQEIEDLEQCRSCFAGHLQKIEKLSPETWTREQLEAELDRAQAIVDYAEDEYGQAADHFARTRSASIFSGGNRGRAARGEFAQHLLRGFAFNLPVLLLGSVAIFFLLTR